LIYAKAKAIDRKTRQAGFVIGRAGSAKISAIEGIPLAAAGTQRPLYRGERRVERNSLICSTLILPILAAIIRPKPPASHTIEIITGKLLRKG
jgi:hypothetical protein